jgi:predicted transcriptional regulator
LNVVTKEVLLSVRVSRQLSGKLERLAKLTERTKSWLVNSIIAGQVDREIAYAEAIREAERSIEREGTIPHDQIVREARARSAARRTKARRQAAE